MRIASALVLSCALAVASVACSVETTPNSEPSAVDPGADEPAAVTQEGDAVHIRFGADEVTIKQADGQRVVDYFQAGSWVGSVSYRAADRSMKMSAPGFEREAVLPFDLDDRIREPQGAGSVISSLGITQDEQTRYFGGLFAADAHLAANPNVGRALAPHQVSAPGIQPQMWRICSSRLGALACAAATLGLCGYAMAVNCLLMGD